MLTLPFNELRPKPGISPLLLLLSCLIFTAQAQPEDPFTPVTDTMLQNPDDGDWLMWRRTLDSWGYSPLDQINQDNVNRLRLVWTRDLAVGTGEITPLAYDGVLYVPQANDVIQAIDAVTGDFIWEYSRPIPEDLYQMVGGNARNNRNIAIYEDKIINTSDDNHIFALNARNGELVWETQILDYQVNSATHSSGPIIADGLAVSGRSCRPWGGPQACIVVAHNASTGEEVWRRRLIPAPGEPGDETWGDVPFQDRHHVGAWMVPSYDPELKLIIMGTSVTSPAPKFYLGGPDNRHLYHNSTLALEVETGEIRWYYQHLNDHWDLDHPFERLLVETRVAAIFRKDRPIIPKGSTVIEADDEVFFIAAAEHIQTITSELRQSEKPNKRVIIAGGGQIGENLAIQIERKYGVRIIEQNRQRCEALAESLSRSIVLNGNASDRELLLEENIEETDVFCAVTNDDEANIMSSMLAKSLGARKVITLINNSAYTDLIHSQDIDIAVSPQMATLGAILTHIRLGDVVQVHSLRRGAAEAIEAIAHGDQNSSKVIGKALGDIQLPSGTNIGALVRAGEVLIAHDDIVVEPDDHFILFLVDKTKIKEVEVLFQAPLSFF